MKRRTGKLKAITMVESVIYLFLFGLIFITIIEFAITLRANNRTSLEKVNVEKVVIYLNEHISDSFKNTLSIDEANSLFASDSGWIRIIKNGGYKEYSLINGNFIYSDNGNIISIIDPDFKIEKLRFDKILNSRNELQGIRMELKIVSIKKSTNFKEYHTSFLIK